MWLINTTTLLLQSFSSDELLTKEYAILSHVWRTGPGEEPTFQEQEELGRYLSNPTDTRRAIATRARVDAKIRACCEFALRHGFDWIWIDTCCIDKTSSAELSEAINSMFLWYARARVCYAFLHDVRGDEDPRNKESTFRSSTWFERGWTLQELLAPPSVVFLSGEWVPVGTRFTLADVIHEITKIDVAILKRERSLDDVSVACRLSWASKRKTTRIEDRAYSLMGIFGVHMSTIYGEGSRAFIRLQEEILKQNDDQSIFAWGPIHNNYFTAIGATPSERRAPRPGRPKHSTSLSGLLASSPSDFVGAGNITPIPVAELGVRLSCRLTYPTYHFTSGGLHTHLPLIHPERVIYSSSTASVATAAVLACRDIGNHLIILFLYTQSESGTEQYYVGLQPPGAEPFRAARLNIRLPEFKREPQIRVAVTPIYVRHGHLLISRLDGVEEALHVDTSRFSFHFPLWTMTRIRDNYGYQYLGPVPMPSDGLVLHLEGSVDDPQKPEAETSIQFSSSSPPRTLSVTIGRGCNHQKTRTIKDLWVDIQITGPDLTPREDHSRSPSILVPRSVTCARVHFTDLGGGRAQAEVGGDPVSTSVRVLLTPWTGYQPSNGDNIYHEYAVELRLSPVPTAEGTFSPARRHVPAIHGHPSTLGQVARWGNPTSVGSLASSSRPSVSYARPQKPTFHHTRPIQEAGPVVPPPHNTSRRAVAFQPTATDYVDEDLRNPYPSYDTRPQHWRTDPRRTHVHYTPDFTTPSPLPSFASPPAQPIWRQDSVVQRSGSRHEAYQVTETPPSRSQTAPFADLGVRSTPQPDHRHVGLLDDLVTDVPPLPTVTAPVIPVLPYPESESGSYL